MSSTAPPPGPTAGDYMAEVIDCGYGHRLPRGELIGSHACAELAASRDRGARILQDLSTRAPRVTGAWMAPPVGRFRPEGPLGYRAATAPGAELRATREDAIADEVAWLDGRT